MLNELIFNVDESQIIHTQSSPKKKSLNFLFSTKNESQTPKNKSKILDKTENKIRFIPKIKNGLNSPLNDDEKKKIQHIFRTGIKNFDFYSNSKKLSKKNVYPMINNDKKRPKVMLNKDDEVDSKKTSKIRAHFNDLTIKRNEWMNNNIDTMKQQINVMFKCIKFNIILSIFSIM